MCISVRHTHTYTYLSIVAHNAFIRVYFNMNQNITTWLFQVFTPVLLQALVLCSKLLYAYIQLIETLHL
jgi:hypothetical protein